MTIDVMWPVTPNSYLCDSPAMIDCILNLWVQINPDSNWVLSGNFNRTARRTNIPPFALRSRVPVHRWREKLMFKCLWPLEWTENSITLEGCGLTADSLREGNVCENYGYRTMLDPLPLLMPQVQGTNYTALGKGPTFSTTYPMSLSPWAHLLVPSSSCHPLSSFPITSPTWCLTSFCSPPGLTGLGSGHRRPEVQNVASQWLPGNEERTALRQLRWCLVMKTKTRENHQWMPYLC